MSIPAPAYVGERDLSGRQPPYIGPILKVNQSLDAGGQADFYGAFIWDGHGYLSLRCLPATIAGAEVDAFLYGDDGNGGWFEVDFFSSLPAAAPTQAPRLIVTPPVQLRLHVINFGAVAYTFIANLIPELPEKGR